MQLKQREKKYAGKEKIDIDSLKEDQKEFLKNKRFNSERHNVFTEVINKIALSSNDDERMQSIDLTETYAYGMSKDLICKKEKIKHNNIIKQDKNI